MKANCHMPALMMCLASALPLIHACQSHSPQLRSFLDPFGNAGALAQNIDTEVLVTEMNRDLPRWAATNADVPCLSSRLGGAQ